MNRNEFRQLAEDRIMDAQVLLSAGRWSCAYYVVGYAVECGLKRCIIGYLRESEDWQPKDFSKKCWTHDLNDLLGLADLETALENDGGLNPLLLDNWNQAKDWSELSRYEQNSEQQAKDLYGAIAEPANGVMTWIREHW